MDINEIKDPTFLKQLNYKEMNTLAKDIRSFIIENVSQTGGHLSSNLGTVELIMTLHRVFDAPLDRFLFDVGHQAYTHKILTGRAKQFRTLRSYQGLSGYLKMSESPYDCFESGHSSTSLSTALGMAVARDQKNEHYHIIDVIGDASIANGVAFEALNSVEQTPSKIIIILNDNDMAISKSVGSLAKSLAKIRTSQTYGVVKKGYVGVIGKIPKIGRPIVNFTRRVINRICVFFRSINLFDAFKIAYIGPVDGHNFKALEKALKKAKNYPETILVHVKTKKGHGYQNSENDEIGTWHGVEPFDLNNGKSKKEKDAHMITFSQVFADALYQKMKEDQKIHVISAAMINGSSLQRIFNDFKNRSHDVGIAEEHAVCFANGLALSQLKPVVSLYSTFMQRAYDEINHDIARINSSVVFLVDRAGIVGEDGETHQGIYDISFLYPLKNVTILMPPNTSYVQACLDFAFLHGGPVFIRYSKSTVYKQEPVPSIAYKQYLTYNIHPQNLAIIIAVGEGYEEMVAEVQHSIYNIGVVNPLFLKPLNEDFLLSIQDKPLFLYDRTSVFEGFGSAITQFYNQHHRFIKTFCVPNENIIHGNVHRIYEHYHLSAAQVFQQILKDINQWEK